MSLADRWRRFDAPRWVSVLLLCSALWTAWQTVRLVFFGWLGSVAVIASALVPAAVTVGTLVLAVAWRRERAWAWVVVVVLGGVQLLSYGGLLLLDGPSVAGALGAAVSALLVVLAVHPAGRARIEQDVRPARSPSWRAPR